uniref:hypothetical protein n=1 Tax=Acidisphaera sp. L21 TaxID=1641851 RepID=UPI001C204ECA
MYDEDVLPPTREDFLPRQSERTLEHLLRNRTTLIDTPLTWLEIENRTGERLASKLVEREPLAGSRDKQ